MLRMHSSYVRALSIRAVCGPKGLDLSYSCPHRPWAQHPPTLSALTPHTLTATLILKPKPSRDASVFHLLFNLILHYSISEPSTCAWRLFHLMKLPLRQSQALSKRRCLGFRVQGGCQKFAYRDSTEGYEVHVGQDSREGQSNQE